MSESVDDLLGTDAAPQETQQKKSSAKKQPKKKATGKNIPHYVFKCRGRYYTVKDPATKQKTTKSFELNVAVKDIDIFDQVSHRYIGLRRSEETNTMVPKYEKSSFKNYLGILRKKLVPALMQRKVEDFERVHTLYVDNVEFKNGAPAFDLPLKLMNKEQLKQFVSVRSIPVTVGDYLDIADAREDIQLYLDAPHLFKQSIDDRKARRTRDQEFLELNDLG